MLRNITLIICFAICTSLTHAQNTLPATKGYTGCVKLGLLNSLNPVDAPRYTPTIQTLHGYRFNPHLSVLGGVEINPYSRMALLPVLLAVKGTLKAKGVSPFVVGELGYALELEQESIQYGTIYRPPSKTLGGRTIGLEVGMQFPIARKTAITASIGFRSQRMEYTNYIWQGGIGFWGGYRTEQVHERLENLHLRIGIGF